MKNISIIKKITVILSILWISGCVTSTQETLDKISLRWQNKNVEQFFIAHGLPTGEFELSTGGKLYEWSTGKDLIPTSNSDSPSSGGTVAITGDSDAPIQEEGIIIEVECTVSITTDAQSIINKITIVRDTIGMWELSRCNEVLG